MPLQKSQCLEAAMTIWGWIFDILTVCISLADVASDILVAIEFYREGHKQFFWLVISSLILSSFAYSIATVEVHVKDGRRFGNCCRNLPRPVLVFLFLPVAQLLPTLHWVFEEFEPSNLQFVEKMQWYYGEGRGHFGTAAMDQVHSPNLQNFQMMSRIDKALVEHLRTHLMFYIETVIESIPQSIIQLIAITYLNKASSIQVFSMSLSLVSIVSKAYAVSNSFEAKVFLFKCALCAMDLFSLFYVFSTILAFDEAKDQHVGNGVYVSYLSFIWIVKLGVEVGYALVFLMVCGIIGLVDQCRNRGQKGKTFCEALGLILLTIAVSIPVVIAVEGMKTIWLLVVITGNEPKRRGFPNHALYYAFVRSGDYHLKMRYLLSCRYRRYNSFILKQKFHPRDNFDDDDDNDDDEDPDRRTVVTKHLAQNKEEFNADAFCGELDEKHGPRSSTIRCRCNTELLVLIAISVGAFIYILGQIFSFLFPFINIGMRFHEQNLLQEFCFWALVVSMVVGLIFLWPAVRYIRFCVHARHILPSDADAESVIQHYYLPSSYQVMKHIVPNELVPHDILSIVNLFLPPMALNCTTLSIEACEEMLTIEEIQWAKDSRVEKKPVKKSAEDHEKIQPAEPIDDPTSPPVSKMVWTSSRGEEFSRSESV